MGVKAILFDKDGTLVDFARTWGPAMVAAMRYLARGDAAAMRRLLDVSRLDERDFTFHPDSPLIAGATADYAPLWADALGRPSDDAFVAEMSRLFGQEGLKTLSPIGVPETVLAELARRGLHLGIATNDAEASARAQSAAMQLDGHLSFVAGFDSGHGRKPGPGMVTAFALHHGLDPAEVAVIGDTLHDMAMARAAGAIAVAVLTGTRGHEARAELEPHADHVIDSIADLPAWLDGLPAAGAPVSAPAAPAPVGGGFQPEGVAR